MFEPEPNISNLNLRSVFVFAGCLNRTSRCRCRFRLMTPEPEPNRTPASLVAANQRIHPSPGPGGPVLRMGGAAMAPVPPSETAIISAHPSHPRPVSWSSAPASVLNLPAIANPVELCKISSVFLDCDNVSRYQLIYMGLGLSGSGVGCRIYVWLHSAHISMTSIQTVAPLCCGTEFG